jgi:hypothetical protein
MQRRSTPELHSLNKPELVEALQPVFTALATAGIEFPVVYGIGVSDLDKGLPVQGLDAVALQPTYGLNGPMNKLIALGLTPRYSSGAGQITQVLLSFPAYDVSLRLREGLVYDTPTADNPRHKTMVPLGADDLATLPQIPAHQIAVDAQGQVKATNGYISETQARLSPLAQRAFA